MLRISFVTLFVSAALFLSACGKDEPRPAPQQQPPVAQPNPAPAPNGGVPTGNPNGQAGQCGCNQCGCTYYTRDGQAMFTNVPFCSQIAAQLEACYSAGGITCRYRVEPNVPGAGNGTGGGSCY